MTTKTWMKGWPLIAAALLFAAWTLPAMAQDEGSDEDLGELISEVGQIYAEGYLAPLVSGFGINQNAGLYHTAAIPLTGLKISFGLKVMASKLDDEDKTFRVTRRVDLSDYLDPGDPGYGDEGLLVAEGPTVFGEVGEDGNEIKGSMTAYWHGLPVYTAEGIPALVASDYVPLVAPEISLGGIAGLRATMRGVPMEFDIGDVGKLKYVGFGLAYSVNNLAPTLPVDVMVGIFSQSLDISSTAEEATFSASAKSYYLGVSKAFSMLTVYGGVAKEESSMDIAYVYDNGTPNNAGDDEDIAFTLDGIQDKRTTLGATLNLGVKINAEMSMGNMTSYAGGLIFGF